MQKEEKIILPDSPEAAEQKQLTLWVSRSGHIFNDERSARYDGSTHRKCECGNIIEKYLANCEQCIGKIYAKRYLAMPYQEWDGETPLCEFDNDKYFFDISDVESYCDECEINVKDLRLVVCEPKKAWELNPNNIYGDILIEDCDCPDDVVAAFNVLNEALRKTDVISWWPGKYRTSIPE